MNLLYLPPYFCSWAISEGSCIKIETPVLFLSMLLDRVLGLETILVVGAGSSLSISIYLKVLRYISLACYLLTEVELLLFS